MYERPSGLSAGAGYLSPKMHYGTFMSPTDSGAGVSVVHLLGLGVRFIPVTLVSTEIPKTLVSKIFFQFL